MGVRLQKARAAWLAYRKAQRERDWAAVEKAVDGVNKAVSNYVFHTDD